MLKRTTENKGIFFRLFLLITLVASTYFIFKKSSLHLYVNHIGNLGYVGAFMGGFFYISSYTITFGALILILLSEKMGIWDLTLFAGLGEIMGDVIMFFIMRKTLKTEMDFTSKQLRHIPFKKFLSSPYMKWFLPVIGAIVIASPLPDELGIALMGISRIPFFQFMLIVGFLDYVGLFIFLKAIYLLPI